MTCYLCGKEGCNDYYCKICARKMKNALAEHTWAHLGTRKRYCAKCGISVKDYGWYSQEFLYRDGTWRSFPPECDPLEV